MRVFDHAVKGSVVIETQYASREDKVCSRPWSHFRGRARKQLCPAIASNVAVYFLAGSDMPGRRHRVLFHAPLLPHRRPDTTGEDSRPVDRLRYAGAWKPSAIEAFRYAPRSSGRPGRQSLRLPSA